MKLVTLDVSLSVDVVNDLLEMPTALLVPDENFLTVLVAHGLAVGFRVTKLIKIVHGIPSNRVVSF